MDDIHRNQLKALTLLEAAFINSRILNLCQEIIVI